MYIFIMVQQWLSSTKQYDLTQHNTVVIGATDNLGKNRNDFDNVVFLRY